MQKTIAVAGLLLLATAALGQQVQPAITSITPNTVPVAGGTKVVIRGTNLGDSCVICSPPCLHCSAPLVQFGGTPAAESKLIDSTMVEAVTPPLMPGTMRVTVSQHDVGTLGLANALTVTGDPLTAFEPLLFPIFLPPVRGQFGSLFYTDAQAWNKGSAAPIHVYGDDLTCFLSPPGPPISDPYDILPGGALVREATLPTNCSGTTGRILYTPRAQAPFLALGLRVFDISRSADSAGTEIPVVRERDFTTDGIALLNVPVRPNFRNKLRVYALSRSDLSVILEFTNHRSLVTLTAGRNDYEPAYGEFNDFPVSLPAQQTSTTVRITYPEVTSPGFVKAPIWAFVTATNSETQQITVVTPN